MCSKILPRLNQRLPSAGFTQQLGPFLKLSRWFGRCPIGFETIVKKSKIQYSFNLTTTSFFLSLILALLLNAVFAIAILKFQHDVFPSGGMWPPSNPTDEVVKGRVTDFLYSLINSIATWSAYIVFVDYFFGFLKAPELANWLNNWNTIEDEMNQIGFQTEVKLGRFVYIFIPLFEFVPSMIFGILDVTEQINPDYVIYSFLTVIYGFMPYVSYAIEDSKALVMLKCLQLGFHRHAEAGAIAEWLEHPSLSAEVPGSNIRLWLEFLVNQH
ncbi:hypothetical protein Fcan01_26840 [Folsomia candida]|uniref:Uncharacterized protein n=1 Tax=Folsomia candida TaxID=158441 RepID=A0A226D0S1_FOLCA|nr:hypothetical protein Fcan01_26840 [Folsomia candida]